MSGVEGWSPSNYLQKLPPKPKPAPAPVQRSVPPPPAPAATSFAQANGNGTKKAPPPVKAKPAVAPKPKPKALQSGAPPKLDLPQTESNGGGFGNDLAAALAKRRQPGADDDEW